MAKVDWDQNNYEKSSGFDALPKGRYLAIVADSDDKTTKNKDGRYFEFEFTVVKPENFKNRKLWARLNVHNPSDVAQRIGREQFNSLADCCGMMGKVQKTEQLHNKMVVLLVGITKDNQDRDANEILGFQKYEGAQPSARTEQRSEPKPDPAPEQRKALAGKFDDMDDDIPF